MIRSTTRLPDLDAAAALDKTADLARDALYVMIGATVLTVQRLQVRRREVAKALDEVHEAARSARSQVRSIVTRVA